MSANIKWKLQRSRQWIKIVAIFNNTTKQISTNIWHKYLALAQLLFQVSSYYVNTMWKRTTWPQKGFQPSAGNAGTTNLKRWVNTYQQMSIHMNRYQYISTNIFKYKQIWRHINKYRQISIHIKRYRYISTNIIKYKQIWMHINKDQQISIHINKYHYISTNILEYKQIWMHINRYQYILTDIFKYEQI